MGDCVLLSKAASKLGNPKVPGTVTISDVRVVWKPDAPGVCSEETILLNAIQRTCLRLSGGPGMHLAPSLTF